MVVYSLLGNRGAIRSHGRTSANLNVRNPRLEQIGARRRASDPSYSSDNPRWRVGRTISIKPEFSWTYWASRRPPHPARHTFWDLLALHDTNGVIYVSRPVETAQDGIELDNQPGRDSTGARISASGVKKQHGEVMQKGTRSKSSWYRRKKSF
ncbi:hypothetical protein NEOLEDRAFT_1146223 [Neolentinus lepideus HHB14362 ss-1]|uniref:Uncharacterized protein n=1 Tax=Neolentinus lepideus HHB14362 ss-1 TaxID=1314782 RepID=A0A165U7Y2_9AGAM|nr:hypothetical protein NEOLEDRAFT_1146223 [Neolentinus lepideus HHB14362 ss-1]